VQHGPTVPKFWPHLPAERKRGGMAVPVSTVCPCGRDVLKKNRFLFAFPTFPPRHPPSGLSFPYYSDCRHPLPHSLWSLSLSISGLSVLGDRRQPELSLALARLPLLGSLPPLWPLLSPPPPCWLLG